MCKISLRNALLLSTALFAVMTVASPLAIRPAAAACSNASPATGETVTCSGTDTTGVYAGSGVTGVTVNILDLAEVNTGGTAITLRDDSFVNLYGTGKLSTTGDGSLGAYVLGDNGTITLNDFSKISTEGDDAHGAYIKGDNGTIMLNDFSSISTSENRSYGAYIEGNYGAITLNDFSSISTSKNESYGAYIKGDDGTIMLNDFSAISTSGTVSYGALIDGDNGTITLNNFSSIVTSGNSAHGARIFGDYGSIVLNGASSINTSVAVGAYIDGNSGAITLNDSSRIITYGSYGFGVYIDGNYATITLNDSSKITTSGYYAFGVYIEGDNGAITLNDTSSISTTGIDAASVRFNLGSNTLINYGTLTSHNAITVVGDDDAANSDTIENYGTIYSGAGTAVTLNAGDDSLTLGTGSAITGDIDGGDDTDSVTLTGSGSEDDDFLNFETLTMAGTDWALSGTSSFSNLSVTSGTLSVDGAISAAAVTVGAAGIIGGNGTLIGDIASSGTIAAGNSVGTLTIDGDFMQTGGRFEVEFDSSGMDLVDVTGGTMFAGSPSLIVIPLVGTTSISGVILHSDGGISGTFGSIEYEGNGGVSLTYSTTDITLTVVDGTPIVASTQTALQTALNYFDHAGTASGETCGTAGDGAWRVSLDEECSAQLWVRSFGQLGREEASDGNQAFAYRAGGVALGADAKVSRGLRFGGSFGASMTDEKVADDAAEAAINGMFASVRAAHDGSLLFFTGVLLGGFQAFELSRLASISSGTATAEASTVGWLGGGSFEAGLNVELSKAWRLRPSAKVSYLHQWVNGYEESGADLGNLEIGQHGTGALHLKAEVKASRSIEVGGAEISPYAKLGLASDASLGGTAIATMQTDDQFEIDLGNSFEGRAIGGLGVDLTVSNGSRAYLSYEGEVSPTASAHALLGGITFIW